MTKAHWSRIGLKRRSGVTAPLFSLFSNRSIGIGEIPDLKLLGDWCRRCQMSLIQILPLNDVGMNFRPYDADSAFALEPVYLSLRDLVGVNTKRYQTALKALSRSYPVRYDERVDYKIKKAKMDLLWKIFKDVRAFEKKPSYRKFLRESAFWLEDYALYKALKERFNMRGWFDWPDPVKSRDPEVLKQFKRLNQARIDFYKWLQWQLYE